MATASDLVAIANGELGQGEIDNNNITKYGKWYGFNSEWCAMFVSYCFWLAGMPLAISNLKGFAYCPDGVKWFKKKGLWHTNNPKPGDVVFFDWHPGKPDCTIAGVNQKKCSGAWHVGIVKDVHGGNDVTSIDGNFGRFPSVVSLQRHVDRTGNPNVIWGFGRPDYDGTSIGTPSLSMPVWPGRYILLTSPLTSGSDVLQWQKRLIDLGYTVGTTGPTGKGDDGYFGPLSHDASVKFQGNKGLVQDGIIGPRTWKAAWS